jgi:hypothetical protein
MTYQHRRVVMSFKAHDSDEQFCVGTLGAKVPLNPDVAMRFYGTCPDTLAIKVLPKFAVTKDGETEPIGSGELTIVPRTKGQVKDIKNITLSRSTDVNVPKMPDQFSTGEHTAAFEWSHCMEFSFTGCFGAGWETQAVLAPEVRKVWNGLKSLRKGGSICVWIQPVGTNETFFTSFVAQVKSANIPWVRYRGTGNSTHWIEFNNQLPPLPSKVDKDGKTMVIREAPVERFLDLHAYEVALAVAVKRDDDFQTAQLRMFEGVMHSITIKALQGAAYGYMHALVKLHTATKNKGKMPGVGAGFQIQWYMPGRTSEDKQDPEAILGYP